MTEREQWRFQWPDGTWIRWNPQTQSWEKEDQGEQRPRAAESPPASTIPSAPSQTAAERAAGRPTGWQPVSRPAPARVEPTPIPEPRPEPIAETEPQLAEAVTPEAPQVEEPEPEPEPEPVAEAPARTPRRGVSDVIPPREPDRPGGSLWPTVAAGAIVGIAVGLLLASVIR